MAGVNLSQSMASQEEKAVKRPFSASGFPLSIVLFLVTLLGWGGLRWYIHIVDQKTAGLDVTLAQSENRLHGEDIDQVTDFDTRLALLGASEAERVDPETILTRLEALIIPQVVLIKYEYNKQERLGTIVGETDNFRYLAEQLISLKSERLFSQAIVDQIIRGKDGKVRFTLKASF